MKKKEIKNLATRIVECELIIAHSDDKEAISKAQNEIMRLSRKITDINDLLAIDALAAELLEKKEKNS